MLIEKKYFNDTKISVTTLTSFLQYSLIGLNLKLK